MLAQGQWNSSRNAPPLSKRALLESVTVDVKASKLAGRNTLDYTDASGVRRIRLHKTDILTIKPDGGFTIDTGGWNTHTTRDRLNEFLPKGWRVHTLRGEIHLSNHAPGTGPWRFRDSITVNAKGAVKPDISDAKLDALRKQIDACMREWRKRGLPTREESGDPWVLTTGKIDEAAMLDWVKSKYVHRTLYFMAHKWAGMTDFGAAHRANDVDRRGGKLDRFDLQRIRRYIRACLGLAA
jgi:hypothetical protein